MRTWTSFADGPAAGKTLTLARAPVFLRVVVKPSGETDALDLLDDVPEADEVIHAYRLDLDSRGTCHVDRTDPKTRRRVGEWYRTATYRLIAQQPAEGVMRFNERWTEWCQEEHRRTQQPKESP